MRTRKIVIASFLAVSALFTLNACGSSNSSFTEFMQDADVSSRNTAPADVINFPDGFPNVSTKCDNGNRIYVTRGNPDGGRDIAVVADDPSCD
jgi:hypothetical protein